VSDQFHVPAASRGNKPRYPLDRMSGWPKSLSGRYGEEKIIDPTGTRTQAFQLFSQLRLLLGLPTIKKQYISGGTLIPSLQYCCGAFDSANQGVEILNRCLARQVEISLYCLFLNTVATKFSVANMNINPIIVNYHITGYQNVI
jgi:hypothetical protein